MSLGAIALRRLSTLLDEALALPLPQREAWLAALEGHDAALRPTLRDLLEKAASHETGGLLDLRPAFALPPAGPSAGDTVGPYRLLRELGSGGMGAVWLAERSDGSLTRKVALKLPHITWAPGLAERFAREREILAGLEHPHIARLYDAGVDLQGRPFMALEYVEGQPIDRFCELRRLPLQGRLRLLLQVAEAVAFAHSRLVVHRDLKPANILVTDDGQVRLLDFGIAKLMQGGEASETALTQAAGRALTPDYASPEQIRGEPIGTASDVYSLGVVAFELLAGTRPYRLQRRTAVALAEAITTADVPLASAAADDPALKAQLSGDLDAILNRTLKKQPIERYPTVDALAQDWRNHLAGHRVQARPDTLGYRLRRFGQRHRTPLAAGAGAVLVFTLALGVGAMAVVVAALLIGLGAALWQGRRAAAERDRALALAERNDAVNLFLDTLLTKVARAGPLTAEQMLERSERLIEAEVKGNAEHRAFVLTLLASSYNQLSRPGRAEPLLERAVALARDVPDPAFRDSLVIKRALMAGRVGRFTEAEQALDAILARRTATPEARAEAHAGRATIADYNGEPAATLHHAIEALRWYRLARHLPRRREPSFLALLAWAYHANGRAEEADRHQAASAAAYEALGLDDSAEAVQNREGWAMVQQERGDLRAAIEEFDRCLAAGRRADPDGAASLSVLANRGYVLAHFARHADADADYLQAATLARQQDFQLILYNIRMCRVELLAMQGRLADAEQELREAETELGIEVPERSAAHFARQLADAHLALLRGDGRAAAGLYSLALEEKQVSAGTINALLGRSAAHARAGDLDRAQADAEEALDFARRLQGHQPASFRTGLALLAAARVHDRRGMQREARELADAACRQLDATVDARHPGLEEARRLATPA